MSTSSGSTHFGSKLFMALLVSLVVGLAWACVSTGRSPMVLLGSTGTPEEPPKREPPKTEPVKQPIKPAPTSEQPPRKVVAPPPAPLAPLSARSYSAQHMKGLFDSLDDMTARGRFLEARTKVLRTDPLRVPPDKKSKFNDVSERIKLYNDLMKETLRQSMETPILTRIFVINGGGLIVHVIDQDETTVTYETITNIRSTIDKSRIESMDKLLPAFARAAVIEE